MAIKITKGNNEIISDTHKIINGVVGDNYTIEAVYDKKNLDLNQCNIHFSCNKEQEDIFTSSNNTGSATLSIKTPGIKQVFCNFEKEGAEIKEIELEFNIKEPEVKKTGKIQIISPKSGSFKPKRLPLNIEIEAKVPKDYKCSWIIYKGFYDRSFLEKGFPKNEGTEPFGKFDKGKNVKAITSISKSGKYTLVVGGVPEKDLKKKDVDTEFDFVNFTIEEPEIKGKAKILLIDTTNQHRVPDKILARIISDDTIRNLRTNAPYEFRVEPSSNEKIKWIPEFDSKDKYESIDKGLSFFIEFKTPGSKKLVFKEGDYIINLTLEVELEEEPTDDSDIKTTLTLIDLEDNTTIFSTTNDSNFIDNLKINVLYQFKVDTNSSNRIEWTPKFNKKDYHKVDFDSSLSMNFKIPGRKELTFKTGNKIINFILKVESEEQTKGIKIIKPKSVNKHILIETKEIPYYTKFESSMPKTFWYVFEERLNLNENSIRLPDGSRSINPVHQQKMPLRFDEEGEYTIIASSDTFPITFDYVYITIKKPAKEKTIEIISPRKRPGTDEAEYPIESRTAIPLRANLANNKTKIKWYIQSNVDNKKTIKVIGEGDNLTFNELLNPGKYKVIVVEIKRDKLFREISGNKDFIIIEIIESRKVRIINPKSENKEILIKSDKFPCAVEFESSLPETLWYRFDERLVSDSFGNVIHPNWSRPIDYSYNNKKTIVFDKPGDYTIIAEGDQSTPNNQDYVYVKVKESEKEKHSESAITIVRPKRKQGTNEAIYKFIVNDEIALFSDISQTAKSNNVIWSLDGSLIGQGRDIALFSEKYNIKPGKYIIRAQGYKQSIIDKLTKSPGKIVSDEYDTIDIELVGPEEEQKEKVLKIITPEKDGKVYIRGKDNLILKAEFLSPPDINIRGDIIWNIRSKERIAAVFPSLMSDPDEEILVPPSYLDEGKYTITATVLSEDNLGYRETHKDSRTIEIKESKKEKVLKIIKPEVDEKVYIKGKDNLILKAEFNGSINGEIKWDVIPFGKNRLNLNLSTNPDEEINVLEFYLNKGKYTIIAKAELIGGPAYKDSRTIEIKEDDLTEYVLTAENSKKQRAIFNLTKNKKIELESEEEYTLVVNKRNNKFYGMLSPLYGEWEHHFETTFADNEFIPVNDNSSLKIKCPPGTKKILFFPEGEPQINFEIIFIKKEQKDKISLDLYDNAFLLKTFEEDSSYDIELNQNYWLLLKYKKEQIDLVDKYYTENFNDKDIIKVERGQLGFSLSGNEQQSRKVIVRHEDQQIILTLNPMTTIPDEDILNNNIKIISPKKNCKYKKGIQVSLQIEPPLAGFSNLARISWQVKDVTGLPVNSKLENIWTWGAELDTSSLDYGKYEIVANGFNVLDERIAEDSTTIEIGKYTEPLYLNVEETRNSKSKKRYKLTDEITLNSETSYKLNIIDSFDNQIDCEWDFGASTFDINQGERWGTYDNNLIILSHKGIKNILYSVEGEQKGLTLNFSPYIIEVLSPLNGQRFKIKKDAVIPLEIKPNNDISNIEWHLSEPNPYLYQLHSPKTTIDISKFKPGEQKLKAIVQLYSSNGPKVESEERTIFLDLEEEIGEFELEVIDKKNKSSRFKETDNITLETDKEYSLFLNKDKIPTFDVATYSGGILSEIIQETPYLKIKCQKPGMRTVSYINNNYKFNLSFIKPNEEPQVNIKINSPTNNEEYIIGNDLILDAATDNPRVVALKWAVKPESEEYFTIRDVQSNKSHEIVVTDRYSPGKYKIQVRAYNENMEKIGVSEEINFILKEKESEPLNLYVLDIASKDTIAVSNQNFDDIAKLKNNRTYEIGITTEGKDYNTAENMWSFKGFEQKDLILFKKGKFKIMCITKNPKRIIFNNGKSIITQSIEVNNQKLIINSPKEGQEFIIGKDKLVLDIFTSTKADLFNWAYVNKKGEIRDFYNTSEKHSEIGIPLPAGEYKIWCTASNKGKTIDSSNKLNIKIKSPEESKIKGLFVQFRGLNNEWLPQIKPEEIDNLETGKEYILRVLKDNKILKYSNIKNQSKEDFIAVTNNYISINCFKPGNRSLVFLDGNNQINITLKFIEKKKSEKILMNFIDTSNDYILTIAEPDKENKLTLNADQEKIYRLEIRNRSGILIPTTKDKWFSVGIDKKYQDNQLFVRLTKPGKFTIRFRDGNKVITQLLIVVPKITKEKVVDSGEDLGIDLMVYENATGNNLIGKFKPSQVISLNTKKGYRFLAVDIENKGVNGKWNLENKNSSDTFTINSQEGISLAFVNCQEPGNRTLVFLDKFGNIPFNLEFKSYSPLEIINPKEGDVLVQDKDEFLNLEIEQIKNLEDLSWFIEGPTKKTIATNDKIKFKNSTKIADLEPGKYRVYAVGAINNKKVESKRVNITIKSSNIKPPIPPTPKENIVQEDVNINISELNGKQIEPTESIKAIFNKNLKFKASSNHPELFDNVLWEIKSKPDKKSLIKKMLNKDERFEYQFKGNSLNREFELEFAPIKGKQFLKYPNGTIVMNKMKIKVLPPNAI